MNDKKALLIGLGLGLAIGIGLIYVLPRPKRTIWQRLIGLLHD